LECSLWRNLGASPPRPPPLGDPRRRI